VASSSSNPLGGVEATTGRSGAHRQAYLGSAFRLPILLDDPEKGGFGSGLGATANVQLPQDRRNVVPDRPLREEEPLGDLAIAEASRDELEHLELPRGQAGRVLPRARTGPSRDRLPATPAQASADERGRLIERRPDVALAPPGSNESKHGERKDARHRESAVIADCGFGGFRGLVPAPAIQVEPRAARNEEVPPEVHAALAAVLEPVVQ